MESILRHKKAVKLVCYAYETHNLQTQSQSNRQLWIEIVDRLSIHLFVLESLDIGFAASTLITYISGLPLCPIDNFSSDFCTDNGVRHHVDVVRSKWRRCLCKCRQAAEQQVNPLMSFIWLSCRRNNRSQNTLKWSTESYKIRTRSQPRSQVLSYHIAWFWLRQVHNVTHSPTLKMSSGTFATAIFSGVLNSHKDMPHYSIACLPCIMWVDQAQCQQLHTKQNLRKYKSWKTYPCSIIIKDGIVIVLE